MCEKIAVSVIIPIYNVEAYLKECLDSAVRQTLKEIEILCIDDGSTDRSAEIAREYAEAYDNVILLHKENGGQSSARNLGMDHARGEYLYFLDSDDVLERNALENLYSKACREDLDIVYFNAVPFFETEEDQKSNAGYIAFYKRKGDYSGVYSGRELFARMAEHGEFLGSACLQIFRRSMAEEYGLRFYNGIIHEDNLFFLKCAMAAKRAGYMPEEFYHRRLRGGSTMTTGKSMKNVEGHLITISEMLRFLRKHPVDPETQTQVFRYLYGTIGGEVKRILQLPGTAEHGAALSNGDPTANYLLYMIMQDEAHTRSILDKYESSIALRVGMAATLLPRMVWNVVKKLRKGA